MKISQVALAQHNYAQQAGFKGLWGNRIFKNTESLYGGEYDCDYYEKPYYPFADETRAEIDSAKLKMQNKLQPINDLEATFAHGTYTSVSEKKALSITKEQFIGLLRDCRGLIDRQLPVGILQGIIK